MRKQRAAVIIGVNKPKRLTPLGAAASNATNVANWLTSVDPGYDVSLLTDKDEPVTYAAIEDEIYKYACLPTRYKFLFVYFSGHGLYRSRSDIWMLSKCPDRPREAIDLNAAIELAKYCGIPNVTFISDACRSLPADIAQTHLEPGGLFPTHMEIDEATSKVDCFRATGRGTSAYEAKIGDERASFLTHALRQAYKEPRPGMVSPVTTQSRTFHVVPNRRLENFLQDTIDETMAGIDDSLDQRIEVSVPSDELIFIAPTDLPTGENTLEAYVNLPLTVSLPAPRAGGADNLQQLKGVGPLREKALNDIGIFHLDQIAQMSAQDHVWLENEKHLLRGLPARYRWEVEAEKRLTEGELAKEETFARAAANRVRDALESATNAIVPRKGDTSARLEHALNARRPISKRVSFEADTGLLVHGARATAVVVGQGWGNESAEIVDGGNGGSEPAVICLHSSSSPGASVAVRFDDGRSILVPGIKGLIGHAHVDDVGMKTLNYIPSVGNSRYGDYKRNKEKIDNLRAAVALASEHGSFRIGSKKEASKIASRVRMNKSSDPTLGLYAAHAYSEASDEASIKSLRSYMRRDLAIDLFDVWMLSSRWPTKDNSYPVFPACPLLTQGGAVAWIGWDSH